MDTVANTQDWENIDLINDLFNQGMDAHEIIAALVKLYLGEQTQTDHDVIEKYYQKADSFKHDDRDRKPFKKEIRTSHAPSQGMVKMVLGVGHKNQIKPRDIVGAITSSANVRGKQIGHIEIFDKHCLVEIPEAQAQHIIRSMQKNGIRGRRVEAELA
jgi:ATP-dependent RNA helicase DeaD